MVVDVAEIFLQSGAHLGHAAAVELADDLDHRIHRVLQHHQLLLQRVERLDVGARGIADEDLLLDLFELGFERVEHREIAVDDRVDERIEHVAGAVAQQLGLALGARADVGESLFRAQPHRQDVVRPDEYARPRRRCSGAPTPSGASSTVCSTANSESSYSSIFGRWCPLRASSTASGCSPNSSAIWSSSAGVGLEHRDPDEAVRPGHVFADVLDRNVAELAAVLVRDAIDEHGRVPEWGRHDDSGTGVAAPPEAVSGGRACYIARPRGMTRHATACRLAGRFARLRALTRTDPPCPTPAFRDVAACARGARRRANSRCCSRSPRCSSRISSIS